MDQDTLAASLLVGGGTTVISKALLGYLVPFVAQLGFGASLGSSAIRSGLIGTASIVTSGVFLTTSLLPESVRVAGASGAYLIESVVTGGLYTGTQALFGLRSQGALYDFTFATLSTAAATGIAAPAGALGAGLLAWSRSTKKAGYEQPI